MQAPARARERYAYGRWLPVDDMWYLGRFFGLWNEHERGEFHRTHKLPDGVVEIRFDLADPAQKQYIGSLPVLGGLPHNPDMYPANRIPRHGVIHVEVGTGLIDPLRTGIYI